MKKFLPSLYLAIIALVISLFVRLFTGFWHHMSDTLFVLSIIYLLLGYMYKRIKEKNLRNEQNNLYGEIHVDDKASFYYTIRVLYISSVLTMLIYLICLYGFGIGQDVFK